MQFYTLIVIYNKHYQDSSSIKSLFATDAYKQGKIHAVIIDNSTRDYHNVSFSIHDHCHYLSMHGNQGLSKAYNAGIDLFKGQLEGQAVVLFDDDTTFDNSYFAAMEKAYGDADIYLPIIYDQNQALLSPSIMTKYRCVLASSLEDITADHINGINTGMMIKGEIFNDYRYDESYFLDYVDHAFIRDMKAKHKKIIYVSTILKQDYSLEGQDYQSAMKRFEISKKDIYNYYRKGLMNHIVYHYLMLRRKCKYLKMYKHICILWK